jgi:hypothetical protein
VRRRRRNGGTRRFSANPNSTGEEAMGQLGTGFEFVGVGFGKSRVAAIVAMIALSALPVLAIGSVAYYSAEKTLTRQIIADNFEQTRGLHEAVGHYINERRDDVAFLAVSPLLRDAQAPASAKSALLAEFRVVSSIFTYVALWDPNGKLIVQLGGPATLGSELPQALRTAAIISFLDGPFS